MIDGPDDTATGAGGEAPATTRTDGGPSEVIRDTGTPAKPVESAVEKASREARERIKAGQPLDPTPTGEPTTKPKPREQSGKFKPTERIPAGRDPSGSVGDSTRTATRKPAAPPAEVDDEEVDDSPEAGRAAKADDTEAGKGKPPAKGEKAGEDELEPEGDEEEVEETDEEKTAKLTVKLPNRREGGEPLEVVMPDEETANAIRMLTNGFEYRSKLDERATQVQRMATDYEELKEIMTFDPAGFAIDAFEKDVDGAEQVALSLLSMPEIWKRVASRVLQWEDPDKFETDAAKIENQNLRRKGELRDMIEEQRSVQKNLRDVQVTVASIIPSDMDEDAQAVFYRDAMRDLKEYAERNNRMTLEVSDIPLILASSGRLRAHNIDPRDAADRIVEARFNRQSGPSTGTQRPATSAPAPKTKPAAAQQKTGKEMVQGSRAKRAAASSPSGGGSPSSAVTPPPNQTIEQRIAWHKERAKKGALMTRGG